MNLEAFVATVLGLAVIAYSVRMTVAVLSKWFVAMVTIAHQDHFMAHLNRRAYEDDMNEAEKEMDVYIDDDD